MHNKMQATHLYFASSGKSIQYCVVLHRRPIAQFVLNSYDSNQQASHRVAVYYKNALNQHWYIIIFLT